MGAILICTTYLHNYLNLDLSVSKKGTVDKLDEHWRQNAWSLRSEHNSVFDSE
jgi:hypothetical protein